MLGRLAAYEGATLDPITEFGANAYTEEEEERSLSKIIDSFNERHGTSFSRDDFLRFERVTREIMDEDMTEMVRNNPADVVYNAFSQAFFRGMVKMFQNDNEIVSDQQARRRHLSKIDTSFPPSRLRKTPATECHGLPSN